MKFIKLSLAAAVLATGMLAADTSEIGISANMALTSNYIWRGMTQTSDAPAIQGGIDIDYIGLHAGVWASNVSTGGTSSMEVDYTVGYGGELGSFSYDVGYIMYQYKNAVNATGDSIDFEEAYLSLGYDFGVVALGATYAKGLDDATDYMEVGVSVPLPAEISLDLTYGAYDEVNTHYSASLGKSVGKFDLSVGYYSSTGDAAGSETLTNVVGTIGTSF